MKKGLFMLFGLLLLLPMISAEIALEQPNSLYNFGDGLNTDVSVRVGGPTEDFLVVDVVCGNSSYEIFKSYLALDSGEEITKNVNFIFGNSLDLSDQDECYVDAKFGDEELESQRFQVSRRISMGVGTAKKIFEPEERITIEGTAVKINGEPVNGFVEIEVAPLNISLSSVVRDGLFSIEFVMPVDVSGALQLNFFSYEEDRNNQITNNGNFNLEIFVRQTLGSINFEVPDGDLTPGDSLIIKAILIDQAKLEMAGDLSLTIFNPRGIVHSQNVISSGEEFSFDTEPSFESGYWKIEAISKEIVEEKLIYIAERNDLVFDLANGTLFIMNIGNVPYVGPIEVLIGGKNIVKQIELAAGEHKSFRLSAPDGDYQIEIRNSGGDFNLGATPLTGRAIGIGSGGFSLAWSNNLAIWIFMVFILGMVFLMVHYRKGISKELALLRKIKKGHVAQGDCMISSGQKVEAGFLVLKVEGNDEILTKIMENAKTNKAGISYDGTHRIMLFAPHLTNKKDNSLTVLKVAKEIEDIVNVYNMKHSEQVNYGMGAGLGEIIAEKKGGKLKFVSVGSVMSSTKRISNEARNEILVSSGLKEKITGTEFKLIKSRVEGVWKVDKVRRDRETHKEFIRDFLDRK